MKTIIFIKNMDDQATEKITEALEGTRVEFEVLMGSKCVVIEGSNDLVHIAKGAIKEVGYIVE